MNVNVCKQSRDRFASMGREINVINDVLTSCAHVGDLVTDPFSHGRRVQATRFRVGEKDI